MIRSLRDDEPVPTSEPRRYVNGQGYVRLRWLLAPGEYVEAYEHRIITGRQPRKRVRHLDGNVSNNDPSNLAVGPKPRVRVPRPPRVHAPRVPRVKGVCAVDDCGRTVKSYGLCSKHAARLERHGDPQHVVPLAERNLARGERNTNWTGAAVTYAGVHQRLRAGRGKASTHACADCGAPARQWSLNDRTAPGTRPSKEGPYNVDLNAYSARCVPCHKALDLAALAGGR